MKKISLFIFTVIIFIHGVLAQSLDTSEKKKLYDPSEDAKVEIAKAVKKAESEGKHVLLQIGVYTDDADHKAKHKIKAKESQGNVNSKKNKPGKDKGKK